MQKRQHNSTSYSRMKSRNLIFSLLFIYAFSFLHLCLTICRLVCNGPLSSGLYMTICRLVCKGLLSFGLCLTICSSICKGLLSFGLCLTLCCSVCNGLLLFGSEFPFSASHYVVRYLTHMPFGVTSDTWPPCAPERSCPVVCVRFDSEGWDSTFDASQSVNLFLSFFSNIKILICLYYELSKRSHTMSIMVIL
ncbi:hypothetical protein V8G54_031267 [Vigna mungo]|uniref:Uncharacterized protein n=1 Tax=Vigna mungo TaxID=3915 RepID=A0AAQ3RM10_VIGMU